MSKLFSNKILWALLAYIAFNYIKKKGTNQEQADGSPAHRDTENPAELTDSFSEQDPDLNPDNDPNITRGRQGRDQ